MSYAEIKPQYYQMHMPDSPWHAGSEGWKSQPWPTFGVNPNLVGPPRLAVEGLGNASALGAYFKPEYERPIHGLGAYFKPVYETPISGLGLGDIPRVSTYRPRDGFNGVGACPCKGVRGFGDAVDNAVMIQQPANKTNAAILIGLGIAVIIGGVVFLGPKKMHANAARKKKRHAKRRPAKRKASKRRSSSSGSGWAGKTYSYWAKIIRRDLAAGYVTPGEVDESLRTQYDKDEGDYRRDGITSASQFVKGVRSKL